MNNYKFIWTKVCENEMLVHTSTQTEYASIIRKF